jgi:exosortase
MRQRVAAFVVCCLGVAVVFAGPLRALYAHSEADNTASHVILIPAISVGLILMRREAIFRRVETSWLVSGILAGIAVVLAAVASGATLTSSNLHLAIYPIVFLWAAGFVWLFGVQAARAAAFPLVFLILTAPFPPALLIASNDFLKDWSTETVHGLFLLTQTPHIRDGYIFSMPFLTIEVADQCSGIRSSIGLFITSLLAGHLFLDSAWKKGVLALAIIPITVFKNAVRIATLSLLTIHVDPGYIQGQLHHEGGIVFFVISLALLTPVLLLLIRGRRRLHYSHRPPAISEPA